MEVMDTPSQRILPCEVNHFSFYDTEEEQHPGGTAMSISTVVYNLLQVSSGGIINGAVRDYWRFVYGQGTQTDKKFSVSLDHLEYEHSR